MVSYGYETWFLTSREDYIPRVFENRVLRKLFGLKKDEILGGREKLHNENEMVNAYSMNKRERNVYRLSVANSEGNRPLRRH
jgi:hypothetical protein